MWPYCWTKRNGIEIVYNFISILTVLIEGGFVLQVGSVTVICFTCFLIRCIMVINFWLYYNNYHYCILFPLVEVCLCECHLCEFRYSFLLVFSISSCVICCTINIVVFCPVLEAKGVLMHGQNHNKRNTKCVLCFAYWVSP